MKTIALSIILIATAGFIKPVAHHCYPTNLVRVRLEPWPVTLQRSIDEHDFDTSYALVFRDQHITTGEVYKTLPFASRKELQFFEQALSALKAGNNGDIAEFPTYSVKRADDKDLGPTYIITFNGGTTTLHQGETNVLIRAIVYLDYL